ncbi:non-receptor tyrosine-protein kinase TYK2 [Aulostomus maculatus]
MGWPKRPKRGVSPSLSDPPQGPGVHVGLFWSPEGERYLSHPSGEISAEELCIAAAQVVGITPLCQVLFALYCPLSRCWYSPNHIFSPDESCLVLHYCMRFYFRNWHGLNKKTAVSRYVLQNGTVQDGAPLLEMSSLEYLFSQAKYEFVNEVVQMEAIQSEEDLSRFKNESLGMAVLHLLHHAVQTKSTLQQVAEKISFETCIPKSFAKLISEYKILTKIRIRHEFKKFVRTFQNTVDKEWMSSQKIMSKYISTLEHMASCFGTETFPVSHLEVREDGSSAYTDTMNAQGVQKDLVNLPATHEILVSGNEGIKFRIVQPQANGYFKSDYASYKRKNKRQSSQPMRAATPNKWTLFCDFPEITHITINGANVCIITQDSNDMEVQMNSSDEARSFISLLDGYYRLTADAHHYLCHEVAPPRVVLSEANGLHGPMHDGFVLQMLKKEAAEEGAFIVRWSVVNYHHIILVVLNKSDNGSMSSHKQFRIQQKGSVFCLDGWDREFSSVKELTESLKSFVLKSGSESYTVKKCCLPKREPSNLLVKRQSVTQTDSFPKNTPDICFLWIKDKEITQEQHLGRGTRTNIYSGRLRVQGQRGRDEDNEFNNNFADRKGIRVVLKILDQNHNDIALAFFETASLMSQVSHRHMVFLHGVSIKGSEHIMVEEFVEFGPLDVFLHKEKASVTPSWKFIVARQLATALNYLETKRLVHGNVCAKNILVARRGLENGTSPFVKLSDPGISLNILSRKERLERIPWIAPECINSNSPIGSAADQWSFGVTLLEICNNGDLPMRGSTLSEKEHFYEQRGRLAVPSSQELASFINMCLTYEPSDRPSFLCVLRELTKFMVKNPDISPSETLPPTDPSVYHIRHLRKIRVLGEGNFGKVTLYTYDPFNDGTGEHVAVKTLKEENGQLSEGWLKEIEILKSLDHNNIVKYKGCCTEMGGQVVQLIMEYLPLGSLISYLPKHKLDMSQCLLFAQQICQGMEYLHIIKRYIHRDLAARNILVENDCLVKIGDFGLTKRVPEGKLYYRAREDGASPVFWYAIECLKDYKFSFSSDMWSFGVTLYEILTRCDPRQNPPTKFYEMMGPAKGMMTVAVLIGLLEKQLRLPTPRECPHEVRIVMEQCWAADPSQRPSFTVLVEKFKNIRQAYEVQFRD